MTQFEVFIAAFISSHIKANKANLLSKVGPVNVIVANGIIDLADKEAAKFGSIEGWFIKRTINKFGASLAPDLLSFEGDGIDTITNFLDTLVVKTPTVQWYDKFNPQK